LRARFRGRGVVAGVRAHRGGGLASRTKIRSRARSASSHSRTGAVPVDRETTLTIGYLQRRSAKSTERPSALYDPATETYADAILHNGQYTGHLTQAYDTAAITHLTDYKK
jgi:hypothetical protein